MATKKCVNGHLYESSIYGDECPFCPKGDHTVVNPTASDVYDTYTDKPTEPFNVDQGTIVRPKNETERAGDFRKMIGLLVTYSHNSAGEVYRLFEGRNIIGRGTSADIRFSSDEMMSDRHLLILFRKDEGIVWAIDQDSSNGTYVNGKFEGSKLQLKSGDVIEIGDTKLLFLFIPQF